MESRSESDILSSLKKKKEERLKKAQERRKQLEIESDEQRKRSDERHRRKAEIQQQYRNEDKQLYHQQEQLQRDKEERERMKERLSSLKERKSAQVLSARLDTAEQRIHVTHSPPASPVLPLAASPSTTSSSPGLEKEESSLLEQRRQQAQLRALRRDRLKLELEEEETAVADLQRREEQLKASLLSWEEKARMRKLALEEEAKQLNANIPIDRAELFLRRWANLNNANAEPEPPKPRNRKLHSKAERIRALLEAKKLERKKRIDLMEAKRQLAEVEGIKDELTKLKYLFQVQNIEFNNSSLWAAMNEMEQAQAALQHEEGELLSAIMRKKMLLISIANSPDT